MRVEIKVGTIAAAKHDAKDGKTYEINDVQAPGLTLRVQPSGCVWQARAFHGGKAHRVRIGPVDLWSLVHVRKIASEIRWHITAGHGVPDLYWIDRYRTDHLGLDHPQERTAGTTRPPVMPRPERLATWTYKEAREAWVAWLTSEWRAGNLTSETVRNYASIVASPAMRTYDGKHVSRITVHDLAETVAAASPALWTARSSLRQAARAHELTPDKPPHRE